MRKSDTLVPAHKIISALRFVFHSGGHCGAHRRERLSEQDVLDELLRRHVITVADLHDLRAVPIQMLIKENGGMLPDRLVSKLYTKGVRHLVHLTRVSQQQLTTGGGCSAKDALLIEEQLAQFGLSLKGAPKLDRPTQLPDVAFPELPRLEDTLAETPPEDLYGATADALFEVAGLILQDGQTLMSSAAKMASRPTEGRRGRRRAAAVVRKYGEDHRRAQSHIVARLMAPVLAAEEAGADLDKVSSEARRHGPAEVDNVVALEAS